MESLWFVNLNPRNPFKSGEKGGLVIFIVRTCLPHTGGRKIENPLGALESII